MQSVMRRMSSPVARCDRCREPIGYPLNPKCLRPYLGFCIETLCDLGYDTIGFKYVILCSTPYCVESKENHGGFKLAGTFPPSWSKNITYYLSAALAMWLSYHRHRNLSTAHSTLIHFWISFQKLALFPYDNRISIQCISMISIQILKGKIDTCGFFL